MADTRVWLKRLNTRVRKEVEPEVQKEEGSQPTAALILRDRGEPPPGQSSGNGDTLWL